MDAIIATLVAFGAWVWGLVKNVFLALWDMLVDGISYVADKVLSFGVSMLGGVDVSGVQAVGAWGTLPAEILNVLGLLGFGTCMGIIAAALAIRLGLQLIPFVRLGS